MVPRGRQRRILALSGFFGGAALWSLYAWLMLHPGSWVLLVVYAGIGACCGLALATISRLMVDFVDKQFSALRLRQYTDRSHLLLASARRELEEVEDELPAEVSNDLAAVDFLQRRYLAAVEGFRTAAAGGSAAARANLLPALAETGQWPEVQELLRTAVPTTLEPANLARLAAMPPDAGTLDLLRALGPRQFPAPLLNNLGARALRENLLEEARRLLELALNRQAAYAPALANRGLVAYHQGQLSTAITDLAAAAALTADPTVYNNLGVLLAQARQGREAVRWLLRAELLEPRHAAIQVNLGNAYAANGQYLEAQEALLAAFHGGQEAAAQYNLSLVLLERKDEALALEALKTAEQLEPRAADVLNNLGVLCFRHGDYHGALEYFERLKPVVDGALYRRNLLRAELAADRVAEARALLEHGDLDPAGTALERGVLHLLAALAVTGDTETHRQMRRHSARQAAAAFREIIAAGQGPVIEATSNLGLTQLLEGEYAAAGDTFALALRGRHNHVTMHYAAGVSYVLAGVAEQAQHEAPGADLAPQVRDYFHKAIPFMARAIELPEFHEVAAYDLGLLHYMLRDYDHAIETLRKVVRQDSPPAVLTAMALAMARHAQELQLQAQTATLLTDARRHELRQQAHKLLTSAIHYFRQVLHANPENPLTHANVGLAFMLRNEPGDVETALQHWQLMHRHGDARARKAYEEFMQAVSVEDARRLQFQDVELSFKPLRIHDWIALVPPELAGPRYLLEEILDVPEYRLAVTHRAVRKCLSYQDRATRVREHLRRLAI